MSAPTKTQLYVGDLPQTVDEEFIRTTLFSEYGEIKDVILKKKRELERKFAFVTFGKYEDAARALNEMNYTKLDGVPIRICWADAETRRIKLSGIGNLYIKGLDESFEVSQLHEAFSNFGDIISCKIPMNKDKTGQLKSNGYGYIQFRTAEDAEKAMKDLADASINDKKISIEKYQKKSRKNPEETFTNLYVKGLNPNVFKTDQDLQDLFAQFGRVQNARLLTSSFQGQSLPFGFANMENHEDAVRAVAELNNRKDGEYELVCCRAMSKAERMREIQKSTLEFKKKVYQTTRGRNLYIRGFDENVTEQELNDFFSNYGQIETLSISKDAYGVSKKFGFVCFKTEEGAINSITGTTFDFFRGKPIYVGFAQRKEDRERLNSQSHGKISPPPVPPPLVPLSASPLGLPTILFQGPNSERMQLIEDLIEHGIEQGTAKQYIKEFSDDQVKVLIEDREALRSLIEKLQ